MTGFSLRLAPVINQYALNNTCDKILEAWQPHGYYSVKIVEVFQIVDSGTSGSDASPGWGIVLCSWTKYGTSLNLGV